MYRARRTTSLRDLLTIGGRIPPSVGLLILLVIVASLGSVVARNAEWAVLRTGAITDGELWRLVSWPFVVTTPLGLVFAGIGLYFFAPSLAYSLGEARMLIRIAVLTLGAALATLFVSWLLGVPTMYLGIWPLLDGLVLTWALMFPNQQIMIYFVIPVSGRMMALFLVGLNGLYLLWALLGEGIRGLVPMMPPLASLGIAWVLWRGGVGLPVRRWQLRLREWRLERQYRRRSRHLQVVKKDGSGGPKQWMN